MPLKTILVCLNSESHTANLTKAAAALARKHDAHVIGLHAIEALVVYPGVAMHIPGSVYEHFNDSQRAQSEAIKKIFVQHTENEDFVAEWRLLRSNATSAATRIIESARAADLVIMAREEPDLDDLDQFDVQSEVIRSCGRPVLVVPPDYDGPAVGASALIGWSATREATRAVHDMVEVADKGASATILCVNRPNTDELADHGSNDLAAMLDRHGLKTKIVHRDKGPDGIAEVLMHEAFESGADMIVTGAFGHSRVYDFVIGAVTRDLLHNAELPVLYSK